MRETRLRPREREQNGFQDVPEGICPACWRANGPGRPDKVYCSDRCRAADWRCRKMFREIDAAYGKLRRKGVSAYRAGLGRGAKRSRAA